MTTRPKGRVTRALSIIGFCLGTARLAGADRPNFVFLYPDDQRWDALGVVQREQGERARFPWLRTPNLDALAAQSVRFREAFVVNSLCSPGRACVLTGRYSHLNGIINNRTPFPLDAWTFARGLQQAGYTTAYFGKWHMGPQTERPGFDEFASFIGQGKYIDCPLLVNGQRTPTSGWVDDVTTGYAVDFLRRQTADRPFFLWLGFKSPHGPRGGANLPERLRSLYAAEASRPVPNLGVPAIYNADREPSGPGRNQRAPVDAPAVLTAHLDYMRHIAGVDENVGRVLEALEAGGLAGRTVVVFTSDNGYYLGEHQLGDKRSAYEESLRVPLLIRWPGGAAPSVQDAIALNIDLAPTFLDVAGISAPASVQGRSLRPLLAGRPPAGWRRSFFYEYFKEANFAAPTVLATRTTTAKLITYPGHEEWTEVFELESDPYETRNLIGAGEVGGLQAELAAEHARWQSRLEFRLPDGVDAGAGTNRNAPARARGR